MTRLFAVSANDTQKALELWTKMQEENIIPSNDFLIRLGHFLEENDVKAPFQIPQKTAAIASKAAPPPPVEVISVSSYS